MASTQPAPTVGLLTDFGTSDVYVGVMKSVILRGRPGASLIDLTHDVAPGDVLGGALALEASFAYLPEGAVALAVVDPGVGGPRSALVALAGSRYLVGPDNGLLAPVLKTDPTACVIRASCEGIERARRACGIDKTPFSTTFHGRDVFAPLAAALAGGTELDALGDAAWEWMELDLPEAGLSEDGNAVRGEVLHVDRFGNLVTSIRLDHVERFMREPVAVEVGGKVVRGVRRTYVDVAPGEPVALIGSTGRLEISVRDGSAEKAFGASRGTAVNISLERQR